MIPKIIHYCWLSNDPVPSIFAEYMDGWKDKLSEYEFIKWDFDRFDKTSSDWVREAFENKQYAFAADYIRLYAVYNYGGVYLDMDMEVLKPFDDLLEKEYMFARERPNLPLIEGGCFGAEKGDVFIKKCLDRYEGRHFVLADGNFDQMVLPQVMEQVRRENNISLNLYPWDYFTAKSYETGVVSPSKNTYTIHHFGGSWLTDRQKEIIEKRWKYSRFVGYKIGGNISELVVSIKYEGLRSGWKYIMDRLKKKLHKHGL